MPCNDLSLVTRPCRYLVEMRFLFEIREKTDNSEQQNRENEGIEPKTGRVRERRNRDDLNAEQEEDGAREALQQGDRLRPWQFVVRDREFEEEGWDQLQS